MTLADLIGSFRQDTDDKKAAYLWSDATVTGFLAEAEEQAAVRKRLLFDATTQTIAVVAPTTRYTFDQRFFEWTDVVLYDSTNTTVVRAGLVQTDRDTLRAERPDWRDDKGPPLTFVMEDTAIFLPYDLTQDYTLRIEGYRTPLVPLSLDSALALDQVPEINARHHPYLVYWALHRAYMKPDADTFDANRSAVELARFENYFGYRQVADLARRNQADRPSHNVAYW